VKRLVTALGFTQLLGWGSTFYLPAIIGDAMARDLGLSRAVIYGGVTVMVLVGAVTAPMVGRFADRNGVRWPLAGGSVLLAAGLGVLSVAQGIVGFAAAWGLLGLGGALALTMSPNIAVVQMAGDRARSGVAALSLVVGLSSTTCLPITAWLAAMFGWRGACQGYLLVHLLLALPLHLWVAPPAPARRAAAATARPVAGEGERRGFILLATTYSLFAILAWGIPLLMIPAFQGMGVEPAAAIGIAALFGPAQVASRVGDLVFGRRIAIGTLGVISSALLPLAFLPALIAPGVATSVALVLAYGLGAGTMTVARAMIPIALFDRASYGLWLGRLSVPTQIASAIAPILLGFAMEAGVPVLLGLSLAISLGILASMTALARTLPRP